MNRTALVLVALGCVSPVPAADLDFNRDVRPILAEHCFACHGPDDKARKAELRLDVRADAVVSSIVPGKPGESELVKRIVSTDATEVMPPPKTGKKLTPAQVEVLKKWIADGAGYKGHWAYSPPLRGEVPKPKGQGPAHPIDAFILTRLEKEGLRPSPPADKETLIRRVTLDLTGLPPTLAEIDAFVNDPAPNAYEKVVDRLLASPRYGERMALDWLDAARFADTHGYHIDSGRDMTRWREYVINAFNANMPFDRFTVEQFAGDLLPNPTQDQRVATGFHRNHMINYEGGAIPEEYLTAYIVDRVNTTATVWMGLTIGCAQCHDHKYDPFTMTDFYRMYAFFNTVPENGIDGQRGNAAPVLRMPTSQDEKRIGELKAALDSLTSRKLEPIAAAAGYAVVRPTHDRRVAAARKALTDTEQTVPTAMVMQDLPKPRDTFMLVRGQYDKKGSKVTAGTPASLPPMPKDVPVNRLGLARWLVSPEHPLTARVAVNRYWQAYFGTGLVKTAEDFGTQGEFPSHPELLDWLAVEFRESGWDVKHLQRLIVTSATYRQSSRATPELLAKDPENRLLARMSRLRLPAEFIRDLALSTSGLLNGEIGGKSVSPYQPAGIWEELTARLDGKNFTAQTYAQSRGKDLYRRSMYTFWKRTAPPPSMVTLDAPDRELCTVRRPRTNTPLQALVLMNDPTYVEAARKLAERILKEGGATTAERVTFAFRTATARRPTEREAAVLAKLYETQLAKYRKDAAAAKQLLATGESPRDEALNATELAAWAMVATAILNLDEVVNRN